MVTWTRTADPDVIESTPYFIRRCNGRYLLGRDLGRDMAECLGGFDSADEAKRAADEMTGKRLRETFARGAKLNGEVKA